MMMPDADEAIIQIPVYCGIFMGSPAAAAAATVSLLWARSALLLRCYEQYAYSALWGRVGAACLLVGDAW